MIRVVRDRKGRSVRKDPARFGESKPPRRQQAAVDRLLRQALRVGPQVLCTAAEQTLDIAVLLLKVLRSKEHPLRPNNLAVPGHAIEHPERSRLFG